MTEAIWISLIGSICTLIGVIVTSYSSNKKQSKERAMNQEKTNQEIKNYTDLTLYRIGQLETKQDKYNHLQERMAKVEGWKNEVNRELETIRQHISNGRN